MYIIISRQEIPWLKKEGRATCAAVQGEDIYCRTVNITDVCYWIKLIFWLIPVIQTVCTHAHAPTHRLTAVHKFTVLIRIQKFNTNTNYTTIKTFFRNFYSYVRHSVERQLSCIEFFFLSFSKINDIITKGSYIMYISFLNLWCLLQTLPPGLYSQGDFIWTSCSCKRLQLPSKMPSFLPTSSYIKGKHDPKQFFFTGDGHETPLLFNSARLNFQGNIQCSDAKKSRQQGCHIKRRMGGKTQTPSCKRLKKQWWQKEKNLKRKTWVFIPQNSD